MSLNQAVDSMRKAQLFRNVDDKRLKVIAMMGETLSYRAQEWLFCAGDEGDAAYIVVSGSVDVMVEAQGSSTAVTTLGKGEVFGEIAVLCDLPRTTGIMAHEDVVVLRLGRQDLTNLMQEFPDLALQMIRILGQRLEATTKALVQARQP